MNNNNYYVKIQNVIKNTHKTKIQTFIFNPVKVELYIIYVYMIHVCISEIDVGRN